MSASPPLTLAFVALTFHSPLPTAAFVRALNEVFMTTGNGDLATLIHSYLCVQVRAAIWWPLPVTL